MCRGSGMSAGKAAYLNIESDTNQAPSRSNHAGFNSSPNLPPIRLKHSARERSVRVRGVRLA